MTAWSPGGANPVHSVQEYMFICGWERSVQRWEDAHSPCVGLTAALQQGQQHGVVLVAAVALRLVVEVGQHLHALREGERGAARSTGRPQTRGG